MAINISALKQKIKKAINKMPTTIRVYRNIENEFNEPFYETFVVELIGQYYDKLKGSYINTSTDEGGRTKDRHREKFMVVVDANSHLVQEDDFFVLNDIKYTISDLGNTMDAYFDFSLERTCGNEF